MAHNPIKQRLVGGIILVSLAVIFLPMLLSERDGEGVEENLIPPIPGNEGKPTTIIPLEIKPLQRPAPEAVARQVIEAPETPGAPSEAEPPAEEPAPVVTAIEATDEPPTPKEQTTAAPEKAAPVKLEPEEPKGDVPAWIVQVGSFSSQQNAFGLRDQLRGQGYATFVEKVESGKTAIFRVRVGPEVSVERAEQLKQRLNKEMKLNGVVMRHR